MVNTLAVDNEAKQTIEALKSELQKTKEKLQAVEELKAPSGMRSFVWEVYNFACCSIGRKLIFHIQ